MTTDASTHTARFRSGAKRMNEPERIARAIMRLTHRQQRIIIRKLNNPAITQASLASSHRVSERTIRRDVLSIKGVVPSLAYVFA